MKQHRRVRMDTQRVLGARYVLEDTGCTRQLESLCMFTCVQLFVTPMDLARQAPLTMGFPRQEYSRGLLPGETQGQGSLVGCVCGVTQSRTPIPGILQARILEWVAISFFNA